VFSAAVAGGQDAIGDCRADSFDWPLAAGSRTKHHARLGELPSPESSELPRSPVGYQRPDGSSPGSTGAPSRRALRVLPGLRWPSFLIPNGGWILGVGNLTLIGAASFLVFIAAAVSQAVSARLPARRGTVTGPLLACLALPESALLARALWLSVPDVGVFVLESGAWTASRS
jgi:hypothetical protein